MRANRVYRRSIIKNTFGIVADVALWARHPGCLLDSV